MILPTLPPIDGFGDQLTAQATTSSKFPPFFPNPLLTTTFYERRPSNPSLRKQERVSLFMP